MFVSKSSSASRGQVYSLNLSILKRVGGTWFNSLPSQHHQVDGDKFVCLDDLLEKEDCIIYSFGIKDDWTFEDQMDSFGESRYEKTAVEGVGLGCLVFAYDHTIEAPPTRGHHIKFFKTGLGVGQNLRSLSDLIRDNNHQHSTIDYLKEVLTCLTGSNLWFRWILRAESSVREVWRTGSLLEL